MVCRFPRSKIGYCVKRVYGSICFGHGGRTRQLHHTGRYANWQSKRDSKNVSSKTQTATLSMVNLFRLRFVGSTPTLPTKCRHSVMVTRRPSKPVLRVQVPLSAPWRVRRAVKPPPFQGGNHEFKSRTRHHICAYSKIGNALDF